MFTITPHIFSDTYYELENKIVERLRKKKGAN